MGGLGGKTNDPGRPGCSGLFKSLIGCGTWIKLPGFPIFKIGPNGIPIPQDDPTDPVEPGDPGSNGNPGDPDESDDDNTSVQRESSASERTSVESTISATLTGSLSRSTTVTVSPSSTQIRSSTKLSTLSTQFSSSQTSTRTSASRSTVSQSSSASASATSTAYIIRLVSEISATQLGVITDDVKRRDPSMYSISLGSRPNDTVICSRLNSSSLEYFSANSLVSQSIGLRLSPR